MAMQIGRQISQAVSVATQGTCNVARSNLSLRGERADHGTSWDIARALPADVVCLPRVECSAGRSTGGSRHGCVLRRTAARSLDANVHGRSGAVHIAVVSLVSARRVVREAYGRQRFDQLHRAVFDHQVRNQAARCSRW